MGNQVGADLSCGPAAGVAVVTAAKLRGFIEGLFIATVMYEGAEIEVNVTYEYTPGSPGSFYAPNGDPGDPPESAECEVTSITPVKDPKSELLDKLDTAEVEKLFEEACLKGSEHAEESLADYDDSDDEGDDPED